ncbi:MAG TPA: T9SS type A sorting domain-containing protein [Flavobacteriales bacterium]|nr:T9SS type A sorting domain-containing protein [Flavobacteriales bacterium]
MISGRIRFPGDSFDRGSARLLANGLQDLSFPTFPLTNGGGKLTKWQDRSYVSLSATVRRLDPEGLIDPAFLDMNQAPYFSSFQGGDYHVFPDGRVVLGGRHMLSDTVRGFVGPHCLTWFSNEGYLDTTRTHRPCNGVLTTMKELPNGQFIGSGSMGTWDGQSVGRIIRFNANGSLDPSFQANVVWGTAYSFLPMADGRIYAGGNFRIEGLPDTLNLVRFMPDGSLDPEFNYSGRYRYTDSLYPNNAPKGYVFDIEPLPSGQLIVTGAFAHVDGEARGSIALIDSLGNLLEEHFADCGTDGYFYQPNTAFPPVSYHRTIAGITPAPDGQYYIWGAYHGYDDGTTNDTLQRMVSRLHGFNLGVQEVERTHVRVYPNPAHDNVTIETTEYLPGAVVVVRDALGRVVLQKAQTSQVTHLSTRTLSDGIYSIQLLTADRPVASQRLLIYR